MSRSTTLSLSATLRSAAGRWLTLLATAALASCGGGGGADEGVSGQREQAKAAAPATLLSSWSTVKNLPMVPVAIANLPDGKMLMWSAEQKFDFLATNIASPTYTAVYDPATGAVTERLATEVSHNMFCPGTTNMPDGKLLVSGGISSQKSSLYDPATGRWSNAGNMTIARGYNANTLLQDGRVLTLGGSWSGGVGGKHGEVWTAGSGWKRLTGVRVDPFLSTDASRNFGGDSHFWMLPAGNGKVFHAGPGVNMQWIDTTGDGSVTAAGRRSDDEFSLSGSVAMYAAGKILKTGGGPGYDAVNANANSYIIDLTRGATVRKLAPMAYRRAFHNSVVLPNGQVVIIGGQSYAVGFSDNDSILTPELFDPATETFVPLPPISVPRNYHSTAILLPDARVVAAGGGLCGGCTTNHADLQILTPHYLKNADGSPAKRPVLLSAPATVRYGQQVAVAADSPISSFALVRMSSTTHTVNNDQRRLALSFTALGNNQYQVEFPTNPGWALPGDWMLFAMNAQGTPSVAKIVRVQLDGSARLQPIADVRVPVGGLMEVPVAASGAAGAQWTATGLPPGVSIDPVTGVIRGVATAAGSYAYSVQADVAGVRTSIDAVASVVDKRTTRYVKLEALGEVNGNPWASAAEINLLDNQGNAIARTNWRVSADSQELVGENGAIARAFDGQPSTHWHTAYQPTSAPYPHTVTIDLGGPTEVTGLRYLPRQDTAVNGTIAGYRIWISGDGIDWGVAPVAAGNFSDLGAAKEERAVYFENVALRRPATQSSTYDTQVASRAVDGNRDGAWNGGSLADTQNQANPWWEVDLGTSHALFAVRLWNRTDCCQTRLGNFYLLASDTPMAGRTLAQLLADASVWRVNVTGSVARQMLLTTAGARGRYLRVQLAGTNELQLAEVEVHGTSVFNRDPVIAALTAPPSIVGTAVSLAVAASDPDGDRLAYSAAGLPPGLSIDAASGAITGTPTQAGTWQTTVRADDGRGGSAAAPAFAWTVIPAAPQVLPAPNPTGVAGSSIAFTANTQAIDNYRWQWNFGDGSAVSAWASTSEASHTYARAGVYRVTVTAEAPDGRIGTRSWWQAVTTGVTGQGGQQSSPIAVAPTDRRVWAVNPDNDSVSVFDPQTRTRLAEIAVGTEPRTVAIAPDGRAWVVNHRSDSISIVSPSTLAVVQTVTLASGSRPYGLVFDPAGNGYLTLEATGELLRVRPSGGIDLRVPVGADVRHLTTNTWGTHLLVSRFLTPPQPGEGTATVSPTTGAELVLLETGGMTVQTTVRLAHSERADSTMQGRGIPNYLGAAALAPDGSHLWVPSKQDNIARGTLRDGKPLTFENTVRAISSRINVATLAEDPAARVDFDNSGVASAAVFHPDGAFLFVALEASREVAVVDAAGNRELFRVDAGRAPQGLAVSTDGQQLYVHNFMDRSVGVYDLAPLIQRGETALPVLATMASIATDKLGATVLAGKQLFYDARDIRLARDGYLSCASCHHDGASDGRVWDMTSQGEGLRRTIDLRGRAGAQGRLHWSANADEVQDFEGQIRSLAQGTGLMSDAALAVGTRSQALGDPKKGVSIDLDALAAYVESLRSYDPSPMRNADGSLTISAQWGRTVFAANCASCHSGADFSDSASGVMHDVGTIKASSGKRMGGPLTGIDTPSLRNAWAQRALLHDGSARSVEGAVRAHTAMALSESDLTAVSDFVRQIGNQEPAVAAGMGGLRADYFANTTLTGPAVLSRFELPDFDWGLASPGPGVPADGFSARWSGMLTVPTTGNYQVRIVSDEGMRVSINGVTVLDHWAAHSLGEATTPAMYAPAGARVPIVVEYYDISGAATARLQWLTPGASSFVAIPISALSPN